MSKKSPRAAPQKPAPSPSQELIQLMTPCKDKEHLQAWISKFLGITLPDQTLSLWADSNPLDFVWTVYDAMMKGEPLAILALSGRDSGKSLCLSIIDLLSLLHDKRSTIHIGMTEKQAQRAKSYLEEFVKKNTLLSAAASPKVGGKQNTTELKLNVGGEIVGMEILPCTKKAVQGGHASLLSLDELASSMEPQNVKAYKDAHGILGASKNGKPAIVVKITSRQTGFSLAEQELQNAPRSGLKIIKWSTIDTTEHCPDSRSGTDPLPLWINPYRGNVLKDAEFAALPASDREGFQRTTDTKSKCYSCPLAAACAGKLKHQKSDSPILRKIDDVINKVQLAGSWDWAAAQILSLQPSKEGLVYFEYDPKLHIPGWKKMWEVLTGESAPDLVTRGMFVARAKKMKCVFLAGIDWGWSNPSTCVVLCVDRRDNIFVLDAIGKMLTNDAAWVEIIKETIDPKYRIDVYVPDSENRSGIDLFRKADLHAVEVDKGTGSVKAGINIIKRSLLVPGANEVKLFIAPDLASKNPEFPGLVEEFGLYHKSMDATGRILDDKNPAKEFDHFLDGLRYPLYYYFGSARAQLIFAGDTPAQEVPGPDSKDFDMVDFLASHGIHFHDNREEFPDSGSPEKEEMVRWPGKDEDDDDDPDGGGSGGSGGSGLMIA